jgi:hypothetical protein
MEPENNPMRHPKAEQWERRLKAVFDLIDQELEEEYGRDWPLHPARPPEGATGNPEADGLFNVGAAFSADYGSPEGPGYLVEIRFSTLSRVPPAVRRDIRQYVLDRLREELPKIFPGRDLQISQSDNKLKIHGDLSLD